MFALLRMRSFYPLFLVQFLGAFNDNLYKNALVMLITFQLSHSAAETGLLITLAAGLFILPFFLFSSLAGQLADHYPKALLVKKIKLAEVLVMSLGAVALISQDLILLYVTLFLMGTQSAFFGPIKYSILPEILDSKQLIKGNGLFSGSTFIAILLGTIAGGLGVLMDDGLMIMSLSVFVVALIGYLLSLMINHSQTADQQLTINLNPVTSTLRLVRQSVEHPIALTAVLSISWFWFIGATLLSQIPALIKYDLYSDDSVVVLFLTLFSVGIAVGSIIVSRLMQSIAHLHWHSIFLSVMSVLLWLTVWSVNSLTEYRNLYDVSRETLFSISQIVVIWPANLSLIFMGMLALVGGMYIVPLYTIMQTYTPFAVRARMVAVNNIMNSLFMVISAVLLMIGFSLNLTLLQMLSILGVVNLLVAVWLYRKRLLV